MINGEDEAEEMSAFITRPCILIDRSHALHERKNSTNTRHKRYTINGIDKKVMITESKPIPWITFPWTPSTKPYTVTYNLDDTTTFISMDTDTDTVKNSDITDTTTSMNTTSMAMGNSKGNVIMNKFLQPLLPKRYPKNYTTWTKWHISRHIFRSAQYTLGTTSLLVSLGLSNTTTTLGLSSSALKWVLKDGIAMIMEVIISTNFANRVDKECKKFRIIGDSLMCIQSLIEILSLMNSKYFILYGSLSALCKDSGAAMSGPSYRVFLESFSKKLNNIGDISSKGEAQVVIGNVIGLGIGVFLCGVLINERFELRIMVWFILSGFHLLSTINGVNCVELINWNETRLKIIIQHYEQFNDIPNIKQFNSEESHFKKNHIIIGASIKEFWNDSVCVYGSVAISVNDDGKIGIMVQNGDNNVVTRDVIRCILQARRYLKVFASGRKSAEIDRRCVWQECEQWSLVEVERFMEIAERTDWGKDMRVLVDHSFRYSVTRVHSQK